MRALRKISGYLKSPKTYATQNESIPQCQYNCRIAKSTILVISSMAKDEFKKYLLFQCSTKETDIQVSKETAGLYYGPCCCCQCRILTQLPLLAGRLQTQKCLVRSCVSFHLIIHFIRCISMAAFLIGQQRQSVDRLALIAKRVEGIWRYVGMGKGAEDNGIWRRRRRRRRSAFKRQCERQTV